MSETLFSLLMGIGAVGIFGLGWHLRGEHDKPTVTTKPPTSAVTRPSHQIDVKAAPYKIPRPEPSLWEVPDVAFIGYPDENIKRTNLLDPIDLTTVNKRNRVRILANMRAGKRNN